MANTQPIKQAEQPVDKAVATKPVSALDFTARQVQAYAKKLLDDERAAAFFTQVSVMAKRDPKIAQCSSDSLIAAMLACIHLDLMPNTPEQLAHVIPYGKQAQFQVGYKGLLRLAHRSNQVRSVNAEVVYQGDQFDVELGTSRKLTHRPDFDVEREDKHITHAYAVIELTNGAMAFEVMTRKELDKIKAFAKASSTDTPWTKWYPEQCKKTVLKRAFKLIPSSTTDNRLALAAQYDSWAEASKLKQDNGVMIEGKALSDEEVREIQAKRIAAAEEERRRVAEDDFQAKAIEVAPTDGVDAPAEDELTDEERALQADGDRLDAEMNSAMERDA